MVLVVEVAMDDDVSVGISQCFATLLGVSDSDVDAELEMQREAS